MAGTQTNKILIQLDGRPEFNWVLPAAGTVEFLKYCRQIEAGYLKGHSPMTPANSATVASTASTAPRGRPAKRSSGRR
jgi:hypothetical protein